jgi:calmodulin
MTSLDSEELDELRETFDYNDLDHDGSIGLDEFRTMLENLDAGLSAEEAATGFTEIDANHDGLIDFDEFLAWWREP